MRYTPDMDDVRKAITQALGTLVELTTERAKLANRDVITCDDFEAAYTQMRAAWVKQ